MADNRFFLLGLWVLLASGCVNQQALLKADRLSGRVEELDRQGNYKEALPLAEEAVRIRAGELGEGHARVGASLYHLAGVYSSLAEYDRARPLYRRALAIRRAHADRAGEAEILNDLATLHYRRGEYPESGKLYRQALEIYRNLPGSGQQDLARTLGNYGSLLLATGDLDGAQALFERALSIRERAGEQDLPGLASALNNLAMLFHYRGDYQKARPLLERAVAVQKKALGPEHPDLANTLDNLGLLLMALGDYQGARPPLERALAIRRGAYGRWHPQVALSLSNLGTWHWKLGAYAEARPLLERSLAVARKALGPGHPDVAISMNNLATLLDDLGDFVAARELLEKSLALMEKTLGPKHPNLAAPQNNLALLLENMGDYGLAKELLLRSIWLKEETLGKRHPDTLTSVMNLGLLMQYFGLYDEAERILEESLALRVEVQGKEHPDVASHLASLAGVLLRKGQQERAARLYRRALHVWEKIHPDSFPVAGILNDLGMIEFNLGNREKARELVDRSYALRQAVFGKNHPAVMLSMINVVYLHWAAGEMHKAREKLIQGFAVIEKNITPLLDATSERERIALILSQRGFLNTFVSLFDRPKDGQRAYRAILRWKGVVSNSLAAQREAVLASREPGLGDKFDELKKLRRTLARLVFMPVPKGQKKRLQAYLDMLYRKKDQLERELATRSKAFSREKTLDAAGLEQVCGRLSPGQALVDYLAYELLVPDDEEDREKTRRRWKFLAYVLRGGECRPIRVDIGDKKPIDRAVRHYRRLVGQSSSVGRLNRQGKRLRRLIWDPVAKQLGGRKFVWVVPDASLSGVPFGALAREDRGYLIERYTYSYLSSGLDLVCLSSEASGRGDASLVAGGIDYGKAKGGKASGLATHRAPKSESGLFPVDPLPGTRAEADAVASLLGDGALLLTGAGASEQRVKQEGPGRRILHLATHGFFAGGKVASALAISRALGEWSPKSVGFNPMLLSGLVLAGANRRDLPPGAEDGILTAEEVSGLDLRGCELVTLSACETGLGELVEGEGVMGLRRAFSLAGARALVLSLWKVPDQDTRRLMEAFYQKVVDRPAINKAVALREAKLELIEHQRSQYEAADPRSWAAFIVSGL